MNKILFIFLLFFAASCTQSPDAEETAKRNQLAKYKQQVSELNDKIDALQLELDSVGTIAFVPVRTDTLRPALFEHFVEVTGKVEAEKEVDISPETMGRIVRIHVREGDRVQAGTILATLNAETIQRSIEEAEISLSLATTAYERQKNLWDQNIGSEMQFLQAKSNMESLEQRVQSLRAQLDMSRIVSPVDGTVDRVFQKEGEMAGPQTPFAKIVNINELKIYGDLSETHLTRVGKGEQVWVDFPALNKQITTKIAQVGNFIDPNNRTFRIRLDIKNADLSIKPNMVSVLKIRDYVSENALVIPSLLVKFDFRGQYTYITGQAGDTTTAKKVYITPGVSQNNMTEILDGLQAGDQIITEGYEQVSDGSPIIIHQNL